MILRKLLKKYYEYKLSNFSGRSIPSDKRIEYASLMYMSHNIEREKSLSELKSESYDFAHKVTDFNDKLMRALGIK